MINPVLLRLTAIGARHFVSCKPGRFGRTSIGTTRSPDKAISLEQEDVVARILLTGSGGDAPIPDESCRVRMRCWSRSLRVPVAMRCCIIIAMHSGAARRV